MLKTWTNEIDQLSNVETNDILYEKYIDNILPTIEQSIDFLIGNSSSNDFNTDKEYKKFLTGFIGWIKDKIDTHYLFSSGSDIRKLLRALLKLSRKGLMIPYCENFTRKFKSYDKPNIVQLTRLRMIYSVMKTWGINPSIAFKSYHSLSDIERCQHYIVYKTIEISYTYPEYRKMMA